MLIAFHQRAENSVSIHGENYLVEWKTDSSKIAVMVCIFVFFIFKRYSSFLAHVFNIFVLFILFTPKDH